MTKIEPCVVKIKTGSNLYGCATPTSDVDYKEVHFQSFEQLLFDSKETNKVDTRDTDNTENQSFSLKYYMRMLTDGQAIAMDMLFAPDKFLEHKTETWEYIRANKDKLISKRVGPFISYAKNQAIKYGKKGNKLRTLDMALYLVSKNAPFNDLKDILLQEDDVKMEIEKTANKNIRHLVICGKSFGETTDYKFWLPVLLKLRASFGARAELCVDTGIDLKAQYHTVRICREVEELLLTGNITFPRPEAPLLLDIRNGVFNIIQLTDIVEEAFDRANKALEKSQLQENPDFDFAKSLVYDHQLKYVLKYI